MRLSRLLVVLLLVPTIMWGQSTTGSTSTSGDTSTVSEQINKLSEAIATQQQQMQKQQEQMLQQQKELETLRKQLAEQKAAAANAPRVVDASLNTTATTVAAQTGGAKQPEAEGTGKTSPLSFRIGAAEFTPGGFIDFTNVFRTTNTGAVVSSSLGGFPFSNTAAGHLTEIKTTSQYSRISLKMASKVLGADVTGYVETDFNGNDAATVFQGTQPHTLRLRLAYAEVKKGPIQLIAGQAWGWLTPNRVGLGAASADVMITNNSDGNIMVGLPYTRPSVLHVIVRPNKHVGVGFGIETQQQFVGPAGQVVFPTALAAQLGTQADGGAGVIGAPDLHPGILAKIAFDSNPTGRNFHFEVTGIANSDKIAVAPAGTPAGTFVTHTKTGGGIQPAFVAGLTKNFRIVGNAFWSNGQGRQNIALGPDFVVRPDGSISLIHSGSALIGAEAQITPSTTIAAYYGGVYFQRNFFADTNGALIGFGAPNATNLAANRSIQEPTFDISHAFWKNPQWGSLVLNTQSSYLTRSPWRVGNNPKNAHVFMQYVVLRYVLP